MQEKLRDEHRMQLEYAAKMDADEERKKAGLRKMQQRQARELSCRRGMHAFFGGWGSVLLFFFSVFSSFFFFFPFLGVRSQTGRHPQKCEYRQEIFLYIYIYFYMFVID